MKKARHVVIFIVTLLIISILLGYIYGINNFYDLKEFLESLDKNNNLFFHDIVIILIFFFSTISLLGILIQSLFIGFEGLSIGYVLSQFYLNFKIKGLFYSIIYIFINKGLFILILTYLFYIGFKYFKKNINNLTGVNKDYVDFLLKPLIKKYLIILVVMMIYDTIIFFFGNNLLSYLTNVL